jgi:muramidase (phage lysozyme)
MARITPDEAGGQNVCSFLDMLAVSEGTSTDPDSDDGYNVIVGGQLFIGYADHPRRLITLPNLGIKSTAAGRYQLLARYYDAYKKLLRLYDFSPVSQDKIAIQQIRERRAFDDIVAGNLESAITKCSNIWASLPGNSYGQHQQSLDTLRAAFILNGGSVCRRQRDGGWCGCKHKHGKRGCVRSDRHSHFWCWRVDQSLERFCERERRRRRCCLGRVERAFVGGRWNLRHRYGVRSVGRCWVGGWVRHFWHCRRSCGDVS